MTTDKIVEIGIDEQGKVFVKPETKIFEFIWRDASAIRWDETKKILYSPKAGELTHYDWYREILLATKGEYGCQLILTEKTQWTNIPDDLRRLITLY